MENMHESENQERQAQSSPASKLTSSPMMAHLLAALEERRDIGHFGRLTFAMVGRFFLDDQEIISLLELQPDFDQTKAKALLLQVKDKNYNPPKRDRILEWQARQEFPICPNPEDPNSCNVYRELSFPENVYEHVEEFWEEKAKSQDEAH